MNAWPNSHQAVLIIDLQTAMFDGVVVEPVHNAPQMVACVAALRMWAKRRLVPICFIRHDGDGPLAEGNSGWPVWTALNQQSDEPTFSKSVGNAFSQPLLVEWTKQHAVSEIIIVGAQSEHCIAATVKGALDLNFKVTVVSDGHTTWNTENESAAQIINRQNAAFAAAGVRLPTLADLQKD